MDPHAKREIERISDRLLKEADLNKPPIKVEAVLEHLNLHCDYYDLTDPSLIKEIQHVLHVQAEKFKNVLKKIKFLAATVPDQNRIFIDSNIHDYKKKWATLHEASHNILPWHKAFAHADTAESLDPSFQLQLEEEANYSVQRLLFMGEQFKIQALDSKPSKKSIIELKEEFDSSWESTLRYYVENTHNVPMMLIVCPPFWSPEYPNFKHGFRYFRRNTLFSSMFPNLRTENVFKLIDRPQFTSGNIDTQEAKFIHGPDVAGNRHLLRIEFLYNQYDIFILVLPEKRLPISVSMAV